MIKTGTTTYSSLRNIFAYTLIAVLFILGTSPGCTAQELVTDKDSTETVSTSTSDGVCGNVCFRMNDNGLFTCTYNCRYDSDIKLPAGVEFLARTMRENLFPPLVDDTDISVSQSGKKTQIDISIAPGKEHSISPEILRIKYFYSFERNEKWEGVAPEYNETEKKWTASFDVPASESQIFHLTRVQDESDNSYIDIPCKTEKPAIGSPDCFFPMANDEVMTDEENGEKSTFSIDPSLDLSYSYFGYDDRRYYFRIQTVGNIDPGTTIPAMYNYYLVGIFDPYRPANVDPFHKTVFVLYAPSYFTGTFCPMNGYALKTENSLSQNCISKNCSLLVKQGKKWTFDSGSVFCESSGNEILISLQRHVLDPTSVNSIAAYAATGIILENDGAIITDYSPLNSINLDNNSPLKLK